MKKKLMFMLCVMCMLAIVLVGCGGGNTTDDDSNPANNYLPQGTMDYCAEGVVTNGSNAAFCPIFYNADKTYAYSPNAYQTDSLTVAPGQYAYMRLMVCNLSTKDDYSKHLTPDFGNNIRIIFD